MVHYLLTWGDPSDRLFFLTIRFSAPEDNPRLLLPCWRPGRYLIQDYAANVRDWSATGGENDRLLRVWKDGKSTWRVDARRDELVTLRYRYYAGVLDAGSSFLDHDEAYFNGTNLFMLVDGLRSEEHRLSIGAPAEWRIETQLPREDAHMFVARDYDHLIDSPAICAAKMTRHSFSENGSTIHMVFRGDEGLDSETWVEPARAITRAQAEIFGGLPFTDYRFLYHVADKWHGVEHEDSCSIIARRAALLGAGPGDDGWDHFLSITAHELFHVWNVKRIVPERFTPYDYWHETPTRLLWAMEGITSYYGDLSICRAGLWSQEHYLKHLRNEIVQLENLPGRHVLSLAQASYDGWLSSPTVMHDHPNVWISFYNKGEVVAALLDLTIRIRTGGEKSLDDVMRLLWNEYGVTRRGLEEDGFERAVARVADVGEFFVRYVDGTDPLPYAELFAAAGLTFRLKPHSARRASLGAKLKSMEGLLVVDHVVRGGAGMKAGLLPGDELLAVHDVRTTTTAALENALRGVRIGETAELLVSRGGTLRRLSLTGEPDPRVNVELTVSGESELRERWLGRSA